MYEQDIRSCRTSTTGYSFATVLILHDVCITRSACCGDFFCALEESTRERRVRQPKGCGIYIPMTSRHKRCDRALQVKSDVVGNRCT